MLTVLLGGARSGKSALAARMAAAQDAAVVFVATGEAGDEEMAARIERHRAERPATWTTVEAPVDLEGALRSVDPHAFVIVDCLTLWVTNLGEKPDGEVLEAARAAVTVAAGRPGATVAVSNEVGSGVVPLGADVRRWRDLLGSVNACWVAAADRAALVVAGRVLPLADAGGWLDG
jgi:adenosylcobinamide kinase / adenosylcobinamide-phosphate guanylyltransferase